MQGLLEIAISLIFVFLIVSLIVTAINEIITALFKLRPKMLWRGLSSILDDPALREQFYKNGLIVNAKRASAAEMVPASDKNHPSYIDPRNFTKALTMVLGLERQTSAGAPAITLDQVKKSVGEMPESRIKDVLLSALSDVQQGLQDFEKSLEAWYKTAMDRLSGEFKRHNQAFSFLIGLLIAIGMNVDTIAIVSRLNADDELRRAVVAEAVDFADDEGNLGNCTPPAAGAADTAGADPQEPATADEEAALKTIECYVATLGPLLNQLSEAAIGWPDQAHDAASTAGGRTYVTFWLLKILGCLFTAFAVTLGAPFWFDLLKRFVNIRSSGVKPEEKKQEETTATS